MISLQIAKLVEEIASQFGQRKMQTARQDPEACLIAILSAIKRDLPEPGGWPTTRGTIQKGLFDVNIAEARVAIEQEATPTENAS